MIETFDDLMSSQFPQPKFIIEPGVLPYGGKLAIAGREKIGKSYIVLRLLRDLVTGNNPFDCPDLTIPDAVRALYLEQELGKQYLAGRVQKVFANTNGCCKKVSFRSKDLSLRLDDANGQSAIDNVLKQAQAAEVTFFDPLNKFHSKNENDARDMTYIAKELDIFARDHQTAIVYVHHFAKPSLDNPRPGMSKMRGSSAISADIDAGFMLDIYRENVDERFLKLEVTLRHGPEPRDMLLRFDKKTQEVTFEKYLNDTTGGAQPGHSTLPKI